MYKPYMVCKIEHATVNVYYDLDYSDPYDSIDIKAAIHDGTITPSIVEVVVTDTTGNITGADILHGCLISDAVDAHTVVESNDMIARANERLLDKLIRIVEIYGHLNNNN